MLLLISTCPSEEEANRIAKALLKQKLIACANIFPIRSIYWWKGKLEESKEFLLIMKTLEESLEEVERRIRLLHPYEIPEIIALSVAKVSRDYEDWIGRCLKR
jgi:periplasmic divalent cation tolerance protein